MTPDLDGILNLLQDMDPVQSYGTVTKVIGLVAEGRGIKAPLGSTCQLIPDAQGPQVIQAEGVGIRDDEVLLMP